MSPSVTVTLFHAQHLWRDGTNSCEDFRWHKLWINVHQCYILKQVF